MDNEPQNDESMDRREFLGTSGAVAAASWLALTEKTDALAQTQQQQKVSGNFGVDPTNQDYHYAGG